MLGLGCMWLIATHDRRCKPRITDTSTATRRPSGLDNEELDKVLSATCVLHPVKVPTIGMSPVRLIPCRRCGVVMRLPGSAYRGFCCGIAYEACQKRQQVHAEAHMQCRRSAN